MLGLWAHGEFRLRVFILEGQRQLRSASCHSVPQEAPHALDPTLLPQLLRPQVGPALAVCQTLEAPLVDLVR